MSSRSSGDDLPAGDVEIVVRAHRIPLFAQTYALVTRVSGTSQPLNSLEVNGPEVLGEIDPAGEQDLYSFEVIVPGVYTIDTSGTMDTFLSLFGPDSDTALVAFDDDSGPDRLSLLVEELAAGRYIAQVRHFSPFGTGAYGISLRSNVDPGALELQIDGPEVQGDIGQPAESDLFMFRVTNAGEHSIEDVGIDRHIPLFVRTEQPDRAHRAGRR